MARVDEEGLGHGLRRTGRCRFTRRRCHGDFTFSDEHLDGTLSEINGEGGADGANLHAARRDDEGPRRILRYLKIRFAASQDDAPLAVGERHRDFRAVPQFGHRTIGQPLDRREQNDCGNGGRRSPVGRRAAGLPAEACTDQQDQRRNSERDGASLAPLPGAERELAQHGVGRSVRERAVQSLPRKIKAICGGAMRRGGVEPRGVVELLAHGQPGVATSHPVRRRCADRRGDRRGVRLDTVVIAGRRTFHDRITAELRGLSETLRSGARHGTPAPARFVPRGQAGRRWPFGGRHGVCGG